MTECPVAKLAREANEIAARMIAHEEAPRAPTTGEKVQVLAEMFDGELSRLHGLLKGLEADARNLDAESVAGCIYQIMFVRADAEALASFADDPRATALAESIDATLRRIIAALERVSGVKAEDLGGRFYL